MKYFILLLIINMGSIAFTQFSLVKIDFHGNLGLWRPYTETTQLYISNGGVIESNHLALSAKYLIFSKNNYSFYSGVNYQRINHRVKGYSLNKDIVTHSDRLGFSSSFGRIVHSNEVILGHLSLTSEVYIGEFYESYYVFYQSSSSVDDNYQRKKYLFPEVNVSLDYNVMLLLKNSFSLGATVQIGTNLYSDWDQFKKYAWLGVGLELGIGRSKKGKE
jgi:hypothetical protein